MENELKDISAREKIKRGHIIKKDKQEKGKIIWIIMK